MRSNYCSQKFWWLTVEPERRSLNSCCAASATKIDLTWLKNNPGQLFNTPGLLSERQAMLNDQAVASCEDTCWSAERKGLPSRRTEMASYHKTHTDVHADPRVLHINVGSDCNLTCSYCCKQYSTAWLRDIKNNGEYLDEERYQINNNDRILMQLGQTAIKTSDAYQTILREVQQFKSVEQIEISGGEPFLYNGLPELVKGLSGPVDIFTGLGVSTDRFVKLLDQLPSTTTFTISAENIGALYEFNRYGNTWDQFRRNLDALAWRFPYRFCSVLSNLTVHGFEEFQQEFGSDTNLLNPCTDPDYLGASVLDPETKSKLMQHTYKYHDTVVKKTLAIESTVEQKQKLHKYLTQFAERRQLSLEIFPESFVTWLNTPHH
jgi:wyosine [tRNA(Phe)-imidazoG37] synthetase (radical SAM superfamily)